MADNSEDKKWRQPYILPNPEEYSSYQRQIYGTLKPARYPTGFSGWEAAARKNVPAPNFGYVYGSASSFRTHMFNVSAFDRYRIRPHMLVNATVRDVSIELFGRKYKSPLIMSPVGVQSIMHKDGEEATARAAKAVGVPFVYSSASNRSPEDIASVSGDGDRWFQLYWPRPQCEDITASILKRAKANGYQVLVVTLDTFSLAWRPRDLDHGYLPFLFGEGTALGFTDPAFNQHFEELTAADQRATSEKLQGLWTLVRQQNSPLAALRVLKNASTLQKSLAWLQVCNSGTYREWQHLEILKKLWDGPIVLKGIQTVEDAHKAIECGMDGIWISNHGGRQCDGAIASLDALAEIGADETVKRSGIRLVFDSGVRTGSDVLKALALGAHAVGIGRPYMYGLGMGGQAGVEHVMRCMLADMDNMLGNAGKKSIKDLSRADLQVVAFESKL